MLGTLETGKPVRLGYVRAGHGATVVTTPQPGDRLRLWTIDRAAPGAPTVLDLDPQVRIDAVNPATAPY